MASKFRTTEISDPRFESDNLRFITVKTSNLKGRGDICLFVPKVELSENTPLVVLLHGVYGSAWIWSQKAGVHRTAQKMMESKEIKPMIIAMPSDGLWGDGSAYLPHNTLNFEAWIAEDVIAAVKENIAEVTNNSPVYISGLSMGGYGALRIGAKYPQIFKGISGHSSITDLPQMELFVEEGLENYKQEDVNNESVISFMQKNKTILPPFRFDCGKDDELIEHNRVLHEQLKTANIPHIYEEFLGKHEWVYWETHIKDTLRFFNQL
ncbi:acetyl esterase [Wenyingzhuangia fucanilytica]|uniref:Acetyl esterase n=1 Tax=Wenyingzhuangia fucanilytica TaxID=1790137 RepID=A0A1B1Y8X4_9FLAO|nr:alpha/beta hydrolase-fold protein [Wenyingzhuangia fucanilytica]ANW97222.1 acetyl esterase [Wenyingzhuangia fucanilytica]